VAVGKLQEYAKVQREKSTKKLVIPIAKEWLLSQWGVSDRDIVHVHPSEMAKKDWCERSTYYRISQNRKIDNDKFNFTLQTIFDEGHQIHDKWQTWLADAGKLWGDWSCRACGEVVKDTLVTDLACYSCDECQQVCPHVWKYEEVALEHGIVTGHEDGAVEDRLVEFKSVGIGTLRHDSPDLLAKFYNKEAKLYDLDGLWAAMKVPLKSHVRQANVYMWLAQSMGGEYARFDSCSIVYEYKPNQQSREYVIPFSEAIVRPLLGRVGAIQSGLASGKPPPCPYGGCKQCQAYEDETPEPRVQRKRFIWRSAGQGENAESAGPRQAHLRDSAPTRRHNRAGGQCSDEPVSASDGLAEVSGNTARAGRGRREAREEPPW